MDSNEKTTSDVAGRASGCEFRGFRCVSGGQSSGRGLMLNTEARCFLGFAQPPLNPKP